MRTINRTVVFVVAALIVAVPATAELFTVKLDSGTEFDTRYQPRESPGDADRVMFITEQGNWITVAKSEISEIVSVAERKGYGKVIDTTTIELGVLPNDRPQVDPAARQERQSRSALEDFLSRDYNVDQFVDPDDAGGGLPAYGVGAGGGSFGQTPTTAVPSQTAPARPSRPATPSTQQQQPQTGGGGSPQ